MTGPDDHDLRDAFAARRGSADRGTCPAAEQLWSAARGELPAEEGRPLVAHLVDCPACADAWRVARDLEEPAARGRSARIAWTALAAAAVITLAVAGARFWREGPTAAPSYREGEVAPIRSLVPEDRPLPRAACVLRWTDGPPGTRYAVHVATEDLTPVAEVNGLDSARFTVPADALASLPSGARLVWQVEALAPGGGRVSSPAFISRLE